ncbi:MAG: cyclase family protein [Acidobacteriota bacterium]|nr:cyclase family protein [Acidobacteriota bacterium]
MIFSVEINNCAYQIDSNNPIDISIPLDFGGAQPNTYDVEKASATACETGSLIGDTRRGGSCNFEQIKFIPHCNGTHTECVGHITHERISVHDSLKDSLFPAMLRSVEPVTASESQDTYSVELTEKDKLITKDSLEKALEKADAHWLEGLIIRTLPNDESKKTRRYMENLPPFFSTEAINFIRAKNVKHLLVDVPSIDRTFDAGKLSNHRIFWNIEVGEFETSKASLIRNSITEMIFVPNSVEDGAYLLNLQIAAFAADAAPSRPRLFKIFAL